MINSLYLLSLYLIFIFLMHIHLPNLGGIITQPREYFIWIAIFSIVLLSVIKVIRDKTLILPAYRIYVFLFVALVLSSSIFNPIKNMDVFIIGSLHLLAGVIIWLSLHQFNLEEREKENILVIIFASAMVEAAIGIMQFFGLYEFLPITPAPAPGMAGGSFQHIKLFATWIATGLIISLYFISTERFRGYAKKVKIIFLSLVPFLSLSIVIATQRTGLISAALGIIIIILLRLRHYMPAKRVLTVWLILFFVGLAGGHGLLGIKDKIGYGKLAERQIEWLSDSGQGSYVSRVLMYKASLDMFNEKSIFGQGFGNISSLYMYHQAKVAEAEPKYKDMISSYTTHPHNEILKIMSESGIAGIAGILLLIAGFVKILIKLGREQSGLYMALLIPLLMHLMTEFPLGLSTVHYFLFLILVYMATSNYVEEKQIKIEKPAAAFLILLAAAAYLAISAYTIKTFYDYMNMVIYEAESNAYFSQGNVKNNDALPSSSRKGKETKLSNKKLRHPSDINISGAVDNIYLRNWARPMYMFVKAEDAVSDVGKNKGFLDYYLKWSDNEKQRQPSEAVFIADAGVLLAMGIQLKEWAYFDEAMKTAEQGLFLYPNSEALKSLKPKIAAQAFKSILP